MIMPITTIQGMIMQRPAGQNTTMKPMTTITAGTIMRGTAMRRR
ncbi:hypothetical protein [Devosia sp. 2618]